MESSIEGIVVVGGSVAGWAAAVRLALALGGTVAVRVVQSPYDVPDGAETAQVTAVSPEAQRALPDALGVPEEIWVSHCRAAFRVAVRHVNWRTEGPARAAARTLANGAPDHFYRPYARMPECEEFPLLDHWLDRRHRGETVVPFDYACFREPPLLDAGKSPRWLDGRTALTHGWNVDTRLFADFLRNIAVRRLGVRLVRGIPAGVRRDGDGMVTALHIRDGREVAGDFFLDCTGERRLLLAGELGEPFDEVPGGPLCDSAVTVSVSHRGPGGHSVHGGPGDADRVEPYATVTALPDGWAWTTPLHDGHGAGVAYAGELTDADTAARTLCSLLGLRADRVEPRGVRHRPGRLRRAWVKNCLAVGTAACAVEPLAGDALDAVLDTVDRFLRDLPARSAREAPAARFNRAVAARDARELDLARLHFAAAPRADTPFWRAQCELPLSPALDECLAAFRAGLSAAPGEDAQRALLAALLTGRPAPRAALAHRPAAAGATAELFARVGRQQRILLETLPAARDGLRRLHRRAALPVARARAVPAARLHEAATPL
ncbi:tryptophan 7-halogenase [Streptomyces sp. A012304]|uniref:tryptophan 7-halogenase n=1 Tax=Streptomyces sp. A012304 TaxID=375446 RepID=UPI00222F0356|nr:tryptophan 7-halogenase [Streptomyces sp. A012304]GKQ38430.1 tryptophan halogenase [Streptomyces sp. A012304]